MHVLCLHVLHTFTIKENTAMFTIIGTMFTGIVLGYFFRNMDFVKNTEKTISYTIILLLFVMGFSVGSNDKIIENLGTFGWQAAIIAISATCGSILAAWIVLTLFFKKGESHEG